MCVCVSIYIYVYTELKEPRSSGSAFKDVEICVLFDAAFLYTRELMAVLEV